MSSTFLDSQPRGTPREVQLTSSGLRDAEMAARLTVDFPAAWSSRDVHHEVESVPACGGSGRPPCAEEQANESWPGRQEVR